MKFLCDEMCGDIARWLRMLGYDTTYAKDYESRYGIPVRDEDLISECIADFRILLTNDHEMLNKMAIQIDKKLNLDLNYDINFGIPNLLFHSNIKMKTNGYFKPYLLLSKSDVTTEISLIFENFHITVEYDSNTARCPICNTKLSIILDKQDYKELIPDKVYNYHDKFWICDNPSCKKIYWLGKHFQDILSKLGRVKQKNEMRKM
jgi:uncharacterized protein with PIN domain